MVARRRPARRLTLVERPRSLPTVSGPQSAVRFAIALAVR